MPEYCTTIKGSNSSHCPGNACITVSEKVVDPNLRPSLRSTTGSIFKQRITFRHRNKRQIHFYLFGTWISLNAILPLTKHIPARVALSLSPKISSWESATLVDIVTCGLSALRWLTATTRFK
ncbi:hypothetical protein BDR22DRAFT_844035 [Usnea florida]